MPESAELGVATAWPATGGASPIAAPARAADGIVCFGGVDWWYHNRGHYDLQMMRELSAQVPVLYVNSIGMRVPRVAEGTVFLRRIRRKLASLRRGLVQAAPQFHVYSPLALPAGGSGRAVRLAGSALAWQVRLAAWRCNIRRPLLWIACPPAAAILDRLSFATLVYQRTDRFEAFPDVDAAFIRACDRLLKQQSDLVLYCSRALFDAERAGLPQAALVDHGVDFAQFEAAGRAADGGGPEPADLARIGRPRVGFVGGIDAQTFDPPLFLAVARALPKAQFVLVGGCSLPPGWCTLPNVHLLGQRPYGQVASYMAACDVLIMPWNGSEWIRACNPVKLKEYLAVGRPVVSTWFAELEHYAGHVAVARGADEFAAAIASALALRGDAERRRAKVRGHTWASKAETVRKLLAGGMPH